MTDGTGERDPWTVLGLPATASVRQAELAYRRLAKRHHPDRAGTDPAQQAEANRRMGELTAAIDAIRTGAAPRTDAGGWWHGEDPDRDTDWFGFPLDEDPDADDPRWPSRDDRPPMPCPLCGEPFDRALDLRFHLAAAHPHALPVRRRPLLDRLDSLAWRLPRSFTVTVVGLAALVVALLIGDLLDERSGWQLVVSRRGSGGPLLVVAAVLAATMALELLTERHRRRVERAAQRASVRRWTCG